jgi:hypothetical protein
MTEGEMASYLPPSMHRGAIKKAILLYPNPAKTAPLRGLPFCTLQISTILKSKTL